MEKVIKRKSAEAVRERDLRLVTDYNHGISINLILRRNNITSPQTIYNAIDRFNKLLEEEQKGIKNDDSKGN